jgi:hypothetical protein
VSERTEADDLKGKAKRNQLALELLGSLQPVAKKEPLPIEVKTGAYFVHIDECMHNDSCLHIAGLRNWDQYSCHRCGIFTKAMGEMISYLKNGHKKKEAVVKPEAQADAECLQAELHEARERIKELEEEEMPHKKTPAKMIKAWLLAQEDYTYLAIGEKLDCNNDTAARWVNEVENDPKLLKQAKAKLNGKPGKKVQAKSKKIDRKLGKLDKQLAQTSVGMRRLKGAKNEVEMQDEIEFLRWWNFGERKGFVDRLLEEINAD